MFVQAVVVVRTVYIYIYIYLYNLYSKTILNALLPGQIKPDIHLYTTVSLITYIFEINF